MNPYVPFRSRFSNLSSCNNQQRLLFHAPHGTHPIRLNNLRRLLHLPLRTISTKVHRTRTLHVPFRPRFSNLSSCNNEQRLLLHAPHGTHPIPSNNLRRLLHPPLRTINTKSTGREPSMFRSDRDSQISHHATINSDCSSMRLMAPIQYG
jgi:hypothetical protein